MKLHGNTVVTVPSLRPGEAYLINPKNFGRWIVKDEPEMGPDTVKILFELGEDKADAYAYFTMPMYVNYPKTCAVITGICTDEDLEMDRGL